MKKFLLSGVAILLISVSYAQIPMPYIESFDSYTTNQPLNGDGGIAASSHVWVTPYGVVGNCAEFQMTDTAIWPQDTLTSPLIGPLTANTAASFYFRAVTISGGVPSLYHMTTGDQAIIYVGGAGGTGTLYLPQYTIDSTDQNNSSGYIKAIVPAPSFVSGFSGKFKIIAYNPNGHNWSLEFDSLVVRDTLGIVIPPVLSATVTDVSCRSDSTGSIKVTASGASPPYTYLWSPGGETTDSIGHLAAGVYSVTVTDSLHATATLTDSVTQPAFALLLDSLSKTAVKCYGASTGSATIYASGGTAPLHYLWSNIPASSTQTASNLASGNYNVTVTDSRGCSVTATTDISQPVAALTVTSLSSPSSGSNGTATVIPNGGTSPFSYDWSTTPVQTGPEATGLAPGTYYVTVTDENGCKLYDTITVGYPNGINSIYNNILSIYPNPAIDQVFVKIKDGTVSVLAISITDLSGREVIGEGGSSGAINTASLTDGIYIIRVNTTEGAYTRKLMIAR